MVYLRINKKQLAVSVMIAGICGVGDINVEYAADPLVAAICDSLTHALVGAFTYIGAFISRTSNTDYWFFFEIVLCAVFSSVIDADHFITAKSVHLKDATHLKNRPFMHCTTLVLVIVVSVLLLSHITKVGWLYKLGWILAAAFISHHIRDSKRRGFWLWPFGHTKPLITIFYIVMQMFYPQILSVIISNFSVEGFKPVVPANVETV